MDYEHALNLVRDLRLDLVEELKEMQNNLVETITNLSTHQDPSAVIENYRSLEANIVYTMTCLDNLEEDLRIKFCR